MTRMNPHKHYRNAPPKAAAIMESLRGLGYTTATALADIVDNSISAGATSVLIDFIWDGSSSRISILDNGRGMDDPELESAMRLGEKNPLENRDRTDLGRFGMGLKTASFSQCRRLTVASVKNDKTSCLRWDLDALDAKSTADWPLFEGPSLGSEAFLAPLNKFKTGTFVLWESLDRIVTKCFSTNDFNDLIDHVESHFAMVFHRLIQGPNARLEIFLNETPVKPWDPFMIEYESKIWSSPVVKMKTESGNIEVECHVLPHRDKLSPEDYALNGGPEGWTAQQGFYIYRNERLLVAGGWLGLGKGRAWNREEAYRLARIRLDIPNTADAEWKIDIRKSIARPPTSLRPRLTQLAEDTRNRARKVFAYRGSPVLGLGGSVVEQAWRVEQTRAGVRYKIDEKHPVISAVLDEAGPLVTLVKAMLRVIEETVPVQRIWLDTIENKEIPMTGFSGEPPENVTAVLKTIYADMINRRKMSPDIAKKILSVTDPFQNYPELVAGLVDEEAT